MQAGRNFQFFRQRQHISLVLGLCLAFKLKHAHIQFADIVGIAPRGLNPRQIGHFSLHLIKLLLDQLQLPLLLLQLFAQGLRLSHLPLGAHFFLDETLEPLPLGLLEVLHILKTVEHGFLTAILQAAALDPLQVLLATEPVLPKLLHLRHLLPALLQLVHDDGVLVVMLDLVESVQHELVEGTLIAINQQNSDIVVVVVRGVLFRQAGLARRVANHKTLNKIDQKVLLQRV